MTAQTITARSIAAQQRELEVELAHVQQQMQSFAFARLQGDEKAQGNYERLAIREADLQSQISLLSGGHKHARALEEQARVAQRARNKTERFAALRAAVEAVSAEMDELAMQLGAKRAERIRLAQAAMAMVSGTDSMRMHAGVLDDTPLIPMLQRAGLKININTGPAVSLAEQDKHYFGLPAPGREDLIELVGI